VREIKAQIARGDLTSAEALCRQTLENQPDEVSARLFLAFILWRRGQAEAALDNGRHILTLKPDNAGLLSDLGNLFRELGAHADALTALDLSLRLRPGHSGAVYNRALVLDALGREQEALQQIESIGPEDPLFPRARYLRGTIRQDLGDMSGAEVDFIHCTELEPDHAGAWHALVSTRRFAEGEKIFHQLKSRLAESSGDNKARRRYLFALAKIHDDIGDYESASDYLQEANHLVDARYDRQAIEQRLKSLHQNFPSIQFNSGSCAKGPNPVFIVGLPRSGTTLVESLLDGHPEIMALGELEVLPGLISDFNAAPDVDEAEKLGIQYLESLPAEARRSPLVLDKMPENFWRLGHIAAMFPGVKIIHCQRDERDVALSNFFNLYATGNNFAYRLADLAHYAACHKAIMQHWCSLMSSRIFQADYKKLVTQPRESMNAIMTFLGRNWSESALNERQQDARRIRTASNWQVRQEIYTTSIDRWKNYPRLAEEFTSQYRACSERIEGLLG
jgi:tetratricopeptide (TPR) repeat protein